MTLTTEKSSKLKFGHRLAYIPSKLLRLVDNKFKILSKIIT